MMNTVVTYHIEKRDTEREIKIIQYCALEFNRLDKPISIRKNVHEID